MQGKAALSHRHSGVVIRSRISTLMLSMFATVASFYAAGRLWQDAEERVFLTKELDRITGQDIEMISFREECISLVNHRRNGVVRMKNRISREIDDIVSLCNGICLDGHSAVSVDDSLKIIACREQKKKLSELEMELLAARQGGFVSHYLAEKDKISNKRPLVVIGIFTRFDRKNNRDAIRKAWMSSGRDSKMLEDEKGIMARFVIGRSSNHGDSLDRSIDSENKLTNDFFILEKHVEAPEQHLKKTLLFFAHAAEHWNADFYAKVNDDVYVNIDPLGSMLASYVHKPRVYIGCMKSGEVFSEQGQRWYEPDWWKFGDGKAYFRHASGEMFVISKALAKFISINRSILRAYAHDDVTVGSWFIGADVDLVNERKLCCSSWSTGAICSGV